LFLSSDRKNKKNGDNDTKSNKFKSKIQSRDHDDFISGNKRTWVKIETLSIGMGGGTFFKVEGNKCTSKKLSKIFVV